MAATNLIDDYLRYVQVAKRLAPRSVEMIRHELSRLQTLCKENALSPLEVQAHHVRRWLAARKSTEDVAPRTLAIMLSNWRGFYKWLVQHGHTQQNPLADIKAPKSPKPLPKALSVDDALAFAQAQEPKDSPSDSLSDSPSDSAPPAWVKARDQLIVELLYGCGLRVSELVGLDIAQSQEALREGLGWVDIDSRELNVSGKGNKRRSVPLGTQALAALKAYLPIRPVYPSQTALLLGLRSSPPARLSRQAVWAMLKNRSIQTGLNTTIHPHMLRHSFASHVLQSSGDLRAVQDLLGHASIASTQVYTKLDFQHLAKIYDAAHPRSKQLESKQK